MESYVHVEPTLQFPLYLTVGDSDEQGRLLYTYLTNKYEPGSTTLNEEIYFTYYSEKYDTSFINSKMNYVDTTYKVWSNKYTEGNTEGISLIHGTSDGLEFYINKNGNIGFGHWSLIGGPMD